MKKSVLKKLVKKHIVGVLNESVENKTNKPSDLLSQLIDFLNKQHSDKEFTIQDVDGNKWVRIRFGYYKELPNEILSSLKSEFNVEEDLDYDEGEKFVYIIKPKA